MNSEVEVLIATEEIEKRIKILGQSITSDYSGEELVIICVLKGAFVFCSDLIKEISLPIKLEFVSYSSYGNSTESSGNVKRGIDISVPLEGKNVLVVEDIVDTGHTLTVLLQDLKVKKPKSLKLASFLYKPARFKGSFSIDYLAFEIEDKFVIGYGLDYAEKYRELPYLGVLNRA